MDRRSIRDTVVREGKYHLICMISLRFVLNYDYNLFLSIFLILSFYIAM